MIIRIAMEQSVFYALVPEVPATKASNKSESFCHDEHAFVHKSY